MDKNLNSLFSSQTSKEDVENFVEKNLSQADRQKINEVLSDKEKLNEILSSPLARELMKKFRK